VTIEGIAAADTLVTQQGIGWREAYFEAVRKGMDRNYAPMERIFRDVLARTSRAPVAASRRSQRGHLLWRLT